MLNNKEKETKSCAMNFVGRTFFALYQSNGGTMHDRTMFVKHSTGEMMFFEWLQSEREKIEEERNIICVLLRCNVI